jgi:hypothetical protein
MFGSADLEKIHEIATKSRKWAERRANAFSYRHGLVGMCARASANLSTRLSHHNYPARIVHATKNASGHIYVRVGFHIVDITATQFKADYKPVTILLWQDSLPWWWSNVEQEFDTPRDLAKYVRCWDREQQVTVGDYKFANLLPAYH